jgi:hypothetical protein
VLAVNGEATPDLPGLNRVEFDADQTREEIPALFLEVGGGGRSRRSVLS